jgi:hypothetical protein
VWGSHIYFGYASGERVRQPAEICFCFGVGAYSGEIDQGSGVKPISVPVDSDQVIGA